MPTSLNSAIVRIRATDGRVIGAGFLVGRRKVLTCAHVVAKALGLPDDTTEMPQGEIRLDFPLVAPERRLTARVAQWQLAGLGGTGDIAVLELLDEPPSGAQPIRLVKAEESWGHAFRAFGFPHRYENGVWASGRILGQEAAGWLQIEDVKQTGYFVATGFSGGPVWDEALDGVVGMVVAADTTEGVRAAFVIPTERLTAAWPELAAWTIPPCPYRGLLAFREQDAPFFFGREAFTERLVEAVRGGTLTVAVVGSSGSGKSSVVLAGLLPRLRQADAGRSPGEDWAIALLRPGGQPFEGLANALLPLLEPEMTRTERLIEVPKLAGALRQGDVALSRVAAEILEGSPDAGRLLLVIDQFEELYTLCPDPVTRHAFLDLLLQAVAPIRPHSHAPLRFVLTLRADFLGQALAYRPFADLLDQAEKLILGPMNREELEATIVRPAERQGVAFEEGLVARVLDDVGGEPGSLPLLEFALTQLWERQESSRLTHAAYEAIGAVEGALLGYADRVYEGLSELEQEQARQVFMQLVRPGEGTEDTRRLAARPELGEERWPLVRKLADARLVVTGRDPAGQEMVEIAHEALIQRWGRLRTWMEEERDFRVWQERLRAALRQWEGSGRDAGALLRGAPLVEAREWLKAKEQALEQNARPFIQASIAWARRIRWLTVGGIALAFLAVSALGLVAWGQRNVARDTAATAQAEANERAIAEASARDAQSIAEASRQEAEEQRQLALARQLAAQSEVVREQRVRLLPRSTLLAVESERRFATSEGNRALRRALALLPRPVARMAHPYWVTSVAFSPDGQQVATACVDGAVRVWDATTVKLVAHLEHEGNVKTVAFSPDGRWMAAGWGDTFPIPCEARVWEVGTWKEIAQLEHEGRVQTVAFSPDGQWLATGETEGGGVSIYEVVTKPVLTWKISLWGVNAVAFSPDGNWLVTASDDGTARLWGVSAVLNSGAAAGKEIARLEHGSMVESAAFSPDGLRVVTGSRDGTVRIWDISGPLKLGVTTGREVTRIEHEDSVYSVAFSPDGQWVATASYDGTARVWEAATGREVARMANEEGDVMWAVAFSPDGQRVATGGGDRRPGLSEAWVWDVSTVLNTGTASVYEVARVVHGSKVWSVVFSPDGRWVATASPDGTARIWEAETGKELARLEHEWGVDSAVFSPDGRWVATASYDSTARIWETETGKELVRLEHEYGVYSMAFSPNGRWIVTGSGTWHFPGSGEARVWEVKTWREVSRVKHEGGVCSVAFSPDGRWVATASFDHTARVWEVETGQEVSRMTYEEYASVVAFSPDGQWVAAASSDGMVRVWEAETGQEIVQLEHEAGVVSMDFSPGGYWVATGSLDGTVRVLPWRSEELIAEACDRLTRNLTEEEWEYYIGSEPYRKTCPDLPVPEE